MLVNCWWPCTKKTKSRTEIKKQTIKVGTSEMSLVINSSSAVYPALHGATWRVTSPSKSNYGHSSSKKKKEKKKIFPLFIFISFFFVSILHFFCL